MLSYDEKCSYISDQAGEVDRNYDERPKQSLIYKVRTTLSVMARYESTVSMDEVKRWSTGMHSGPLKSSSASINLIAAVFRCSGGCWGSGSGGGWSDEHSS